VSDALRPTKKQKQLLEFIEAFIKEHGYSPSYREVMNGLGYTSVATVALHINNLIKRGHLRKRDRSARSLEVVGVDIERSLGDIMDRVHAVMAEIEKETKPLAKKVDDIYVLIGALHVLGLQDAARSFIPRLSAVKEKSES
jgi:repressor LexA